MGGTDVPCCQQAEAQHQASSHVGASMCVWGGLRVLGSKAEGQHILAQRSQYAGHMFLEMSE